MLCFVTTAELMHKSLFYSSYPYTMEKIKPCKEALPIETNIFKYKSLEIVFSQLMLHSVKNVTLNLLQKHSKLALKSIFDKIFKNE